MLCITTLSAASNLKGTQRNEIWKMHVLHFEIWKIKSVHHTIDTYSEYQWAIALHSEKDNSVITQLLEVMGNMALSVQIETDSVPPIYLVKWNNFCVLHKAYYRYTSQSYCIGSYRKI